MNVSKNPFVIEALRVAIPVGILMAGVAGFAALERRDRPMARAELDVPPPLVKTIPVKSHADGLDLQVDGLVIPYKEVLVAAEVAGRITRKAPDCRPGRLVKQGELLFEIDPRTYQLEVSRLKHELAQSDATLSELDVEVESVGRLIRLAEDQMELQKKNTERIANLSLSNASTPAALDDARRAEISANNTLVTLTNQVQLLKARRTSQSQARDIISVRLQQAEVDLERTRVTAPLDGVVLDNDVQENSYVGIGDPLVKIEDTSAVEVRCNLRMEELQWILRQCADPAAAAGTQPRLPPVPVTCRYKLGTQVYEWPGTLNSYDGSGVDEKTRTVPVRVLVPRPLLTLRNSGSDSPGPPGLMRGMFVQVAIHIHDEQHLLEVDDRAIQPGPVVWRVRDGLLQIVPINIAQSQGAIALVEQNASSLIAGDHLVITPLSAAYQGMPLREEPQHE